MKTLFATEMSTPCANCHNCRHRDRAPSDADIGRDIPLTIPELLVEVCLLLLPPLALHVPLVVVLLVLGLGGF